MVKIISDSTCDLSKEIVDRYNIDIVPLHVLMGDNEYEDGVNITPDEIFAWSDANKTTPKTSAPSMESVIETFKPCIEKGYDIVAFAISDEGREIVCFSISSSMSTSGNVMRIAAEELEAEDCITVIDSANLSTGIGHQVVEAAIMAQHGMNADEIVSYIEQIKPKVRASFVVDTLVYLYRGGRCSGLAAMAGGVLKLHPRIGVAQGKMSPGKKYRGKISKVVMDYVKDMEADLMTAKKDRVFITHSGCDKEIVDNVKEYLKSLNRFDEIIETRAGGVISSHCGPGTLGVLFIDGKN